MVAGHLKNGEKLQRERSAGRDKKEILDLINPVPALQEVMPKTGETL